MAAARRETYQRQFAAAQKREAWVESLNTFTHKDKQVRNQILVEDHVETKRALVAERQKKARAAEVEALAEAERQKERERRLQEREEQLMREAERRQQEGLRQQKLRQKVLSESPELRDLRFKLNAAYVNQARATQVTEKSAQQEGQRALQASLDHDMEIHRQRALEEEDRREAELRERAGCNKDALDHQLEEREQAKDEAYAEFLREKEVIDAVVRRIEEEEEEDVRQRLLAKQETHAYIQQYLKDRAQHREEQRRKENEENQQIREYIMNQDKIAHEREEERKAQQAQRDKVRQHVGAEILKRNKEREEMEDIMIEYHLQKEDARRRQEQSERAEKRLRGRLEMKQANDEMLRLKAERQKREQQQEDELRKHLMEKFAEDEKLEQMASQRRRMRQLEHRRAVEAIIAERRATHEAMIQRDLEDHREAVKREELRHEIVQEERKRMLREHAIRLFGHLPKGVFQGDEAGAVLPQDILDQVEEERRRRTNPFAGLEDPTEP
eukprot:TRINITY_DN23396_c0_g1_i1.p2 TRINITY_DN23396_c0_g1~~TRINITY_DN23396_c0_g1_i1.p2  ORF type:complete len:517 (-),score=149.93 TRINITY_DN23396_c0_g1_i1:34-1536(-)